MGHTFGFLRTASGQEVRLYEASLSSTETEIKTDATNAPGAVPVAQSLGDALNGQTLTHGLFTEASGHLKIVYIMDKSGNMKYIFNNLAKTGAPNLGMMPLYKQVRIEVGDQIRAAIKASAIDNNAILCFQDGTMQHYSIAHASSVANLEMVEYRSGNGLGSAGTGSGRIVAYSAYASDGTITYMTIVDNQNVIKMSLPGASTESFQIIEHVKVGGPQPNLNWALRTTGA
jgi:hypothetical protein